MTNLSHERIKHHANEIYEAIREAHHEGCVLKVDKEGRLDLEALARDAREPITWIDVED